jgi:MOSC domain-containing protein YiiM
MKVKSVNIGNKKEVKWKGKKVFTGIYKFSTEEIFLDFEEVKLDEVVDRKYHGGIDKACYIYSANHYKFWSTLYPNLDFIDGMFGENITISDLDESKIFIGDIYKLGDATVQVTQPRQPCFKLGIRFGNQKIIKQFINQPYPGIYLKVIERGKVKKGDYFQLIERQHDSLSVVEIWDLLYQKEFNQSDLEFALSLPYLSIACKNSLLKRLQNL